MAVLWARENVLVLYFCIMDDHKFQSFLFLSFGHAAQHVRSYFPNQGLKLCPLYWEHRVLTTGLPEKSQTSGVSNNTHLLSHTVLGSGVWAVSGKAEVRVSKLTWV